MHTDTTLTPPANLFVDDQSQPWVPLAEGVQRKVMTYDANVMLMKVAYETGGIGAAHTHHHTQMSYVERGAFEIVIGDEKRTVRAGDAFYIPSNVFHSAVCVEAGMLIDIFSPMREDLV